VSLAEYKEEGKNAGYTTSKPRQDQKWISGPSPTVKTRLLSFEKTQTRSVTGVLGGYNTMGRHIYIMGLFEGPLGRRYGAEGENSAHVLCLSLYSDIQNMGSFFLDPENVRTARAVWNFSK
jgi:hypothetical protein